MLNGSEHDLLTVISSVNNAESCDLYKCRLIVDLLLRANAQSVIQCALFFLLSVNSSHL